MKKIDILKEEIKKCMKSKEAKKLSIYRTMKGEFELKSKNDMKDLSDDRYFDELFLAYFGKLNKSLNDIKLKDSTEFLDKIKYEISVIEHLKPKMKTYGEILSIVRDDIIKNSFQNEVDLKKVRGKIQKEAKEILGIYADGKLISEVINDIINM